MKRLVIIAAVACLVFCRTSVVRAESLSVTDRGHVVVAAIQTGQVGAAGNDFVMLFNSTDQSVDVTGWKLQYRAASAKLTDTWTTKRELVCEATALSDCKVVIPASGGLAISTYTLTGVASQPMASGFSDTGGQIRLIKPAVGASPLAVVDRLGYGTAAESEGSPALAPPLGKSLVRKVNDEGAFKDTDANADDFSVGCYTPLAADTSRPLKQPALVACSVAAPADEDEDTTQPSGGTTQSPGADTGQDPAPVTYLPLMINELLPDPASPALDSADEFIELYNPHSQAVSLAGYSLEAGPDFKYRFTITDGIIPAGGYVAIASSESHLSLTNSGTAVRLKDPAGVQVDSVASYGQAKTGQAYMKNAGGWQWTITPTPNQENVYTTPPIVVATTVKKATATAKKVVAAAPKIAKPPKVAAASTSKPAAKVASVAAPKEPAPEPKNTSTNYLLFGLAGLGLFSYAVYEYRQNIARVTLRGWNMLKGKGRAPETTLQTD